MKMFAKNAGKLGDLYPVLACDRENGLFYLGDRSRAALGFGVIADPLPGGDDGVAERLEVLLGQDWPDDSVLQFTLLASPAVESLLKPQEQVLLGLDPDGVLAEVMRNRLAFLRRAADEPPPGTGSPLRNYVLMVAATVPCAAALPSENEIKRAAALARAAVQTLRTAGVGGRLMDATDLIRELAPFFSGSADASWRSGPVRAAPDLPVNEQLADYDAELAVFPDRLELGGRRVNTYSVKRYPELAYFGNASAYAADPFTGTRGIFVPFMITGTICFPECSSLTSRLGAKRQWTANQAYGPLLKFEPRLALKKQGFDLLFAEMENGARPLRFNLTVTTFCRSREEALAAGSALRSYYRENSFEIMPDRYYILPIFLNALPFGADPASFASLMRFRTLCPAHILPLLPLFADGKGTGTGVFSLISRSGQLMNCSLYDSSTNFNLCVAAQSGSGKSFLVNEIIVSYLARGAECYVIDVGRSYEKLCHLLGGCFLSFGIGSDVSLNPFDCVRDYAEEADMITGLLAIMAAPTEKLSDFQTAELKRVTGELFRERGAALRIDDVAAALGAHPDRRAADLGRQLYSFTSAGEYGRFFAGRNNIKLGNPLTVLELEELKGRRHLQQAVLLQLIYQIQQNMYLGERGRPKLIIIDEAWDLLRDGDVSGFIETGYRRFRKYGGAAVTVTQSVNDLYASPAGRAIAENSANMYLLGQKPETVSILEEEKRLPLSRGEYEFLRSVHTSASYSEIFLVTGRGNSIGRLAVDPFRKLLYTTRAEEVAAIDRYAAQGLTTAEAIRRVLADRAAGGRP